MSEQFEVGGYRLERPFRIRRLGHFHYFSEHIFETLEFYTTLLGFRISDVLDTSYRYTPEQIAELDDLKLYFTRFHGDHHAVVLCSTAINKARGRSFPKGVTVGQVTWQVGSLTEVINGEKWFQDAGLTIMKSGRDTPGSNWHTYTPDPDGHPNEIYYGMEQIGWDWKAKPFDMHRGFHQPPTLPQISEYQEIEEAKAAGIDVASGFADVERLPFDYVVEGIRMPRPFKITGIGPVRMFVSDIEASLAFYRDRLGLTVTEELNWRGHRCVFLRANTEHHSLALYEEAVRDELGLSDRTRTMSLGLKVHSYEQLKNARGFLQDKGVELRTFPAELFPGMDYNVFAVDPDGHMVQLFTYMEQLGWDGRPRPANQRRVIDNERWPDILTPLSDDFAGEPFLGPWA